MYPRSLARFTSMDGTTIVDGSLAEPDRYRALLDAFENGPMIARGAGLSYVAASMDKDSVSVGMRHFNRLLHFDPASGIIEAEAGATLADLLRFLLPKGFLLPVMPGHPLITLGGCIAADAHGKNPARDGTFRDHLVSLDLWHPKFGVRRFESGSAGLEASCGGYGLTGIIISARLKARRLEGHSANVALAPVSGLDEAHTVLREKAADADLIYSWHNWSSAASAPGFVIESNLRPGGKDIALRGISPLQPGNGLPLVNRATIPLMNAAYRFKISRRRNYVAAMTDTLFPMANMGFYFRLYGNGFIEHQVLVPHDRWSAYWPLLGRLFHQHSVRPVITALKLFTRRRRGIAFGGDGVSLTINLVNEPRSVALLQALDQIDCDMGAFTNPIKDSRLTAAIFRRQTLGLPDFARARDVLDPDRRFQSALSARLGL